MKTLIQGGMILTLDAQDTIHERADILLEGDRIARIAPQIDPASCQPDKIIEASDKVIMPGLVNAHLHSNENLFRGTVDNLPLELVTYGRFSPFRNTALSSRALYMGTMLGALEMVRSGVTSIQDDAAVGALPNPEALDAVMQAYVDVGARANVTVNMRNRYPHDTIPYLRALLPPELIKKMEYYTIQPVQAYLDYTRQAIEKWHGHSGRIRVLLGPSAPQRCTADLLRGVAELSAQHNLGVHTHILETKVQAVTGPAFYNQSLIEYVNELGLLNSRLTIAHAIWVTDAEIELMARAGVSVSHNPISNLRLSSGIMPMRKLMDAGINLALGTDGMTNIDMQNVFEVMKFAALLPKIANPDYARYPTSADILRMATYGGARSTLTEKEVGCLAEGYKADLVLLRKRNYPFIPLHDLKNQLVYAENGNSVDTVFINGEVVVQDGKVRTVDEEAIFQEIETVLPEMRQKYAQVLADQEVVMPYLSQAYKQAVIQEIGLNRFSEPLEEWANRIAAEIGLIPEKVVRR